MWKVVRVPTSFFSPRCSSRENTDMFEKSFFRYNDNKFGEFTTSLAYYSNTSLIVGSLTFLQLLSRAGARNIERLINEGVLDLIYDRSQLAVLTESVPFQEYRFVSIHTTATENGKKIKSPRDEVIVNLNEKSSKFRVSQSLAERILRKCHFREISETVLASTKSDVLDEKYMKLSIPRLISVLIPYYRVGENERFSVFETNGGVAVDTNLDFDDLNQQYHRANPESHSSLSVASLLTPFLTGRNEMFFWGGTGADMWLDPAHAEIMKCKVESIEERISKGKTSISRFEDAIFGVRNFGAINMVLHSDFRIFVDFVLSKETVKFKKWLREIPANKELLREYDKSAFGKSKLFSSLPVRLTKLATFSGLGCVAGSFVGAGLVGAFAGGALDLALSAGDEFLLSKIDLGWKPTQWVDQSAMPLLKNGSVGPLLNDSGP